MESVIGLYKTGCVGTDVVHQRPFKALADIEYATATGSTGGTTAACTGRWGCPARPRIGMLELPAQPGGECALIGYLFH